MRLAGHDYYINMLFYHSRLRCFVVVELKAVPFDLRHDGATFFLSVCCRRYLATRIRRKDNKFAFGEKQRRNYSKVFFGRNQQTDRHCLLGNGHRKRHR